MTEKHTPGPWIVATSNSWRRILGARSDESVCEPIKQNDGHPDLYFRNGGADGPDARLIAAAPEMLDALRRAVLALAFAAESSAAMQDDYEAVSKAIDKATGVAP